ncbi:MAG: hypothetical protein WBJ10_13560 [Daejeonella sp.]|uniref:hypothetical protein n=1 Tax=Daejeonella sp. TaxID=2805397 RepID=UPI003350C1AB
MNTPTYKFPALNFFSGADQDPINRARIRILIAGIVMAILSSVTLIGVHSIQGETEVIFLSFIMILVYILIMHQGLTVRKINL